MPCCKCNEYRWIPPQPTIYTDHNSKEYCLLHAPADSKGGISVDDFNNIIIKLLQDFKIFKSNRQICHLKGIVFPGDIALTSKVSETLPDVVFESCFFHGHVSIHNVTTNFINFPFCVFHKNVSFINLTIKSFIGFQNTVFHGQFGIQKCLIEHRATFFFTTFNGSLNISESSFFSGIGFYSSDFNAPTRFTSILTDWYINFSQCRTTSDGVTFSKMDLYWCDFEQFEMTNFHFIDSCWHYEDNRPWIPREKSKSQLQSARNFHQRMKRKYKDEHNDYEASKWHIAEKDVQLLLLKNSNESTLIYWLLRIYRDVSGYGEDPLRAIRTFLIILFIPLAALSLIESISAYPHTAPDFAHVLEDWLRFIPLTKVSFENISLGKRLVTITWQLITSVQATLMAFAIRNRFRR